MQAPTGTVTLVFTDIEGSTQLWERHSDAFQAALTAHNGIVTGAARAHQGYVVKSEGDAYFLVFKRPLDAAEFALEVQRKLPSIALSHGDAVRVRIGLHMGEPLVEFDRAGRADYFGPAVNRAARISAAGHGGQTLMSLGTAHAIRNLLDKSSELSELGGHRLKGIEEPEFIFQLVPAEAAVKRFGPLRTAAANPTNLPAQTTTFVGREGELKALRSLLLGDAVRFAEALKPVETLARQPGVPSTGQIMRDTAKLKNRGARVITLTGPGGCGKTRLAVALASDVLTYFPDGVWFADLSEVADETGMCEAVMTALNNQLRPGKTGAAQQVAWALEGRNCLLVLDTFERLSKFSRTLGLWLRTAPRLKLLITSRELLRVEGEVEYPLGPLTVPEAGLTPPPGSAHSISSYPSVQLFLERAAQAKPGFALTPDNTGVVADICRRLDGVPLALELAAARLNAMSPQQLLQRLQKGFEVVSSRGRDRAGRQSNLYDAIDWSYSLLDAWEKTVLLQLSVFAGPFTLESAEEIIDVQAPLAVTNAPASSGSPPDVMDVVFGLRDKSLLSLKGDDDRYLFEMLGSVREYTRKLYADVTDDVRREELYERHAGHFVERLGALRKLFQNAASFTAKPSESWGLADGLQAADWALRAGKLEMAIELILGATEGLEYAGRYHEAHQRITLLMADLRSRPGGLDALQMQASLRGPLANLYVKAARALLNEGDPPQALALAASAIELSRAAQDSRAEVKALAIQGMATYFSADRTASARAFETALQIARAKGYKFEEGQLLTNYSTVHRQNGEPELMRNCAQEALNIFTRVNYRRGQALAINNLGVAYEYLGDVRRAEELYGESLKIKESLRDYYSAAQSRGNIAQLMAERLEFKESAELQRHVTETFRNSGDRPGMAVSLLREGLTQAALGNTEKARELSRDGLAVLSEINVPARLLDGLMCRAATLRLLGDIASARACAEEAHALAQKIGRKEMAALAELSRILCLPADSRRGELEKLEARTADVQIVPYRAALALARALAEPDDKAVAALLRSSRIVSEFIDLKLAARQRTASPVG